MKFDPAKKNSFKRRKILLDIWDPPPMESQAGCHLYRKLPKTSGPRNVQILNRLVFGVLERIEFRFIICTTFFFGPNLGLNPSSIQFSATFSSVETLKPQRPP